MSLESVTAEWLANLAKVQGIVLASRTGIPGFLYSLHNMDKVIALYDASQGGLLMTDAAFGALAIEVGLPVVTMVGVYVALGSGYYQAREEAKNENMTAGFSQGFVASILKWKWHHVVNRFRRQYLNINHFDEEMNSIRVTSYHEGLAKGFLAGSSLPDNVKKAYVTKIRTAGNVHAPKEWSRNEDLARNQQISYVIDLATTALRLHIIGV